MGVFSCPACGGRAFQLSADLKQAHCGDCGHPLGSWLEVRAKISPHTLRPQPDPCVKVEQEPNVVRLKLRKP